MFTFQLESLYLVSLFFFPSQIPVSEIIQSICVTTFEYLQEKTNKDKRVTYPFVSVLYSTLSSNLSSTVFKICLFFNTLLVEPLTLTLV